MRRFAISRDTWLLVALFLALAGFTGFVTVRQQELKSQQEIFIPYSSHSAQGSGTLALFEWLRRLGFPVQRIENTAFQIREPTRLLLLLGPNQAIAGEEAEYILQWVARGNTLFLADRAGFLSNSLLGKLNVEFDSLRTNASMVSVQQPLSDTPVGDLQLSTYSALKLNRSDFVVYAQSDAKPILVRLAYGSGVIWLSSAPDLFTNENLRAEGNARFAAALIAALPTGATIAFDEYHLGFKPESNLTFLDVLYDKPWGWGVLFTIILLFAYLALNGQRFGRALPVPKTLSRRSPGEYVTSMANLFRRANKRGMVLRHYRHSLKRRLGRPFHLQPDLTDERYVDLLARLRPELDRDALVQLLNSLRRTDITEADLVKTVEQSVTFGARSGQ